MYIYCIYLYHLYLLSISLSLPLSISMSISIAISIYTHLAIYLPIYQEAVKSRCSRRHVRKNGEIDANTVHMYEN